MPYCARNTEVWKNGDSSRMWYSHPLKSIARNDFGHTNWSMFKFTDKNELPCNKNRCFSRKWHAFTILTMPFRTSNTPSRAILETIYQQVILVNQFFFTCIKWYSSQIENYKSTLRKHLFQFHCISNFFAKTVNSLSH